jgi:chromosome partitioning protein
VPLVAARATKGGADRRREVAHCDPMTTVAVANQKGGVAKTTSVHALGVGMAERGKKVLLVDLDPQASLTWACGIDPDVLELSVHDVLLKRTKAADALVVLDPPEPPAVDGRTGRPGTLHLLPSTIDLAGAELHLLTKTGREYVLRKALTKLVDDYDRVLIDCPPSLGILTINGLTAADEVLIPLQCESLSQRGVGQLLDTIDDVRDYTNEDLRVRGAIATMFDGRTKLANQVVEQVRRDYGIDVLEPYVPKSVKVAEAPGTGRSVLTHAPRSASAQAYRDLAAVLLRKPARKAS